MSGCRRCGTSTSRRLCRDCERDQYYEEQARKNLEEEDREDWSVEQQGLDGSAEGQATLDGGISKPNGGDQE